MQVVKQTLQINRYYLVEGPHPITGVHENTGNHCEVHQADFDEELISYEVVDEDVLEELYDKAVQQARYMLTAEPEEPERRYKPKKKGKK